MNSMLNNIGLIFIFICVILFAVATVIYIKIIKSMPTCVVNKEFLKSDEFGGLDLSKFSGNIEVTCYYDGPLVINKNEI